MGVRERAIALSEVKNRSLQKKYWRLPRILQELPRMADRPSSVDARLIQAGLLFRQGVPPQATYLFKHALVASPKLLKVSSPVVQKRREAMRFAVRWSVNRSLNALFYFHTGVL
jgi:hypothetical protein